MILTKEDFFGQLNFEKPNRGRSINSGDDVLFNIYDESGNHRRRISITFKGSVAKEVFPSGFGKFARWKTRIIFIDDKDGFTLSQNSKSENKRMQGVISEDELSKYQIFCGSYQMQYEPMYEYYYIELSDEQIRKLDEQEVS